MTNEITAQDLLLIIGQKEVALLAASFTIDKLTKDLQALQAQLAERPAPTAEP